MITLKYLPDRNVYSLSCPYAQAHIAQGLPDRKFSKRTKLWTAPALRRNTEYLNAVRTDEWSVTAEAEEALAKVLDIRGAKSEYTSFPSWYNFKLPPFKHQAITLDKAFPLNFYALLYDQGLGKTYTSISLACAWRMTNQIDSIVVVCLSAITSVWEEQLPQHAAIPVQQHTLQAGPTATKRFNKWQKEDHDFPCLIVGIEALSNGSGFNKVLDFTKGRRCCVIVDESGTIKNHKANRTDRVDHIARSAAGVKRLILSGTSITGGLEDWYSQFHFLEPDIVGYNNYYSYRNQYCVMVDMLVDPENPEGRTFKKVVAYKNVSELVQAVSFCTSRYTKDEVLDLPPKVHMTPRILKPSPAQKKALQELADDGFTIIEEEDILCSSALVKLLRMQQIVGGFYPVDDPDVTEAQPLPGRNPKVDDMLNWLGDLSGKAIIWANFRAEHKLICKTLAKNGIGYVSFAGGMKKDERKKAIEDFQTNDNIKVFACTYAAAYGLTLTAAQDNYYFSLTHSADRYIQSEDRSHRIGTIGTVTYNYALLADSPDRKLLSALRRKRRVADEVYDQLED